MNIWIAIIGMGLITFALRLVMILALGRYRLSEEIRRALTFGPPAVLTAIFVPELVRHGGELDVSLGNERLLAGLLATIIAWRTRNVILTVIAGMLALWLLQALAI
jgi:branched-subunit amino acid transport protein